LAKPCCTAATYTPVTQNNQAFEMTRLLLCTFLLVSLAGCAVYTPHGAVVVDPDRGGYGGGGFCPPGQAKKGNC